MRGFQVIELGLEDAFFIFSDGMKVEAMNDEVSTHQQPFQTIILLRRLKGSHSLPRAAFFQRLIHGNDVCSDSLNDRIEAVLIELANVEEGEIEKLSEPIPE